MGEEQTTPDATRPVVLVIDVSGLGDLDLVDIGALVRLQLVARRLGASVEVRNAREDLVNLLAFTGLDVAVRCRD